MGQKRFLLAMLKLIGAICIFVACAFAVWHQASSLEKRRRFLQGAHQGLLALMREIDYSASPMQQALSVSAEMAGSAGQLFQQTAERLAAGDGCTAGEAWQETLDQAADLQPEDRMLLSLAAEGLGTSDATNQLKSLELLRLRLEKAEADAAAEVAKTGKIWKTMGWGCGAVLVLLLL